MKKIKLLSLLIIVVLVFSSCKDNVMTEVSYMANVPIYMTRTEMKAAVRETPSQRVAKAGKIYIKDNYLFVNEIEKGIHVFDNSNPVSPKPVVFFNIPGNVDMAIKGNLLYADSYIDLIVLDISNINNPKEIDRVKNAFPNCNPNYNYQYPVAPIDTSKGMIVGWRAEEITVKKDEERQRHYWFTKDGTMFAEVNSKGAGVVSSNIGVAGSMARFAIADNTLYAIVDNTNLKVYGIGTSKIVKKDSIRTNWGIETLFVKGENLYIGCRRGMFIYDISNSETPNFISKYTHITSCDPVVVNDKYAFVTLRSGNSCRGTTNQLNVVSLEDKTNPTLIKSYNLFNPHGLGIDDNMLFICDGKAGLKVYDATDVEKIDDHMLKHFKDIQTYDVIPYNDILIMTGKDGIYQYDYSDINNIKQISHIQAEN